MAYPRLGDLLVSSGVISQEQLGQALARQKETKKRLGEELIDDGIITEQQLIDTLRLQLGIEFVDLSTVEPDPQLVDVLPRNIAKKYGVTPVRLHGNTLYLAMSDPLNFMAQEEVRVATHRRVVPMITTADGHRAGQRQPVWRRGRPAGHPRYAPGGPRHPAGERRRRGGGAERDGGPHRPVGQLHHRAGGGGERQRHPLRPLRRLYPGQDAHRRRDVPGDDGAQRPVSLGPGRRRSWAVWT